MNNLPPTSRYVIACMQATFEHRVMVRGEFPEPPVPPMPEGYKKALEAQRISKIKETT